MGGSTEGYKSCARDSGGTHGLGVKIGEGHGGRIQSIGGSDKTDAGGGDGVGNNTWTKANESGETTDLLPPEPSRYESDSDDSSATTYWQSSSPKSSKCSATNSPLRHLLRKSPKPIAAVTPLRKKITVPFKKCSSRTTRLKRKMKAKAVPSEKDCGCSKQKALVQRVLQDYFKIKKRKKHYKKKTEELMGKLAWQELQFKEPDPEGVEVAGFDSELFKENISEKLSTCLKTQFGRDVLTHAKHQSQLISSQISSQMELRPVTSQCGCLLFDDEVMLPNSQTQRTTQHTGPSQRPRQLVSQRESSFSSQLSQSQRTVQSIQPFSPLSQRFSFSQQSPQSQKSSQSSSQLRPLSQVFSQPQNQHLSSQTQTFSQSSSQVQPLSQLFSQPPKDSLDVLAFTPRKYHSVSDFLSR